MTSLRTIAALAATVFIGLASASQAAFIVAPATPISKGPNGTGGATVPASGTAVTGEYTFNQDAPIDLFFQVDAAGSAVNTYTFTQTFTNNGTDPVESLSFLLGTSVAQDFTPATDGPTFASVVDAGGFANGTIIDPHQVAFSGTSYAPGVGTTVSFTLAVGPTSPAGATGGTYAFTLRALPNEAGLVVPEPAGVVLLGLGMAGVAGFGVVMRRRAQA